MCNPSTVESNWNQRYGRQMANTTNRLSKYIRNKFRKKNYNTKTTVV